MEIMLILAGIVAAYFLGRWRGRRAERQDCLGAGFLRSQADEQALSTLRAKVSQQSREIEQLQAMCDLRTAGLHKANERIEQLNREGVEHDVACAATDRAIEEFARTKSQAAYLRMCRLAGVKP